MKIYAEHWNLVEPDELKDPTKRYDWTIYTISTNLYYGRPNRIASLIRLAIRSRLEEDGFKPIIPTRFRKRINNMAIDYCNQAFEFDDVCSFIEETACTIEEQQQ